MVKYNFLIDSLNAGKTPSEFADKALAGAFWHLRTTEDVLFSLGSCSHRLGDVARV